MNITFSEAKKHELDAMVSLLSDDELGKTRESQHNILLQSYMDAFNVISNDPNAYLIVGHDKEQVIALAQLNFIHCLTFQGGIRAQIEGVRVHQAYRGKGIGKTLFQYLIKLSQEKGCHMVQLTSNKKRTEALDFYKALGFEPTHEGFKLIL